MGVVIVDSSQTGKENPVSPVWCNRLILTGVQPLNSEKFRLNMIGGYAGVADSLTLHRESGQSLKVMVYAENRVIGNGVLVQPAHHVSVENLSVRSLAER